MNTGTHFKIGINVTEHPSNDAMGTGTEKVCELYFTDAIYNEISFWTGEEISMLQKCIDKVNEVKPTKIIQYIDSWGGSAPVGFGIYNFLKAHSAKVETKILNNCASIASVMAMAGNKGKICMPKNGFMVIHQAQNSAQGTASDLREAAEVCDKYTKAVVDTYVLNNRKGKTFDELYACIADGDYWMTGDEALEMGFVDYVYNDEAVTISNSIEKAKLVYDNIPARILNMVTPEVAAEIPQEQKTFFHKILNDFQMKIEAVIAKIKGDMPTNSAPDAAKFEGFITNLLTAVNEAVTADIAEATAAATNSVTAAVEATEGKYKTVLDGIGDTVKRLTDDLGALQETVTAQAATIASANETITAQDKTIIALTADVKNYTGRPAAASGRGEEEATGTAGRQTFAGRTRAYASE